MEEFIQEILAIIKSDKTIRQKRELLQDYHESDIADVIEFLNEEEQELLFKILNKDDLSEVISYVEDADEILEKFDADKQADILEEMDSDDAVDILEELDEDEREIVLNKMEEEAREDAQMILSYDEDQVGRLMTTNFIVVNKDDTISQAMRKLIKQSGDNDNISTIFVVDDNDVFYAAIDLKDLIRARKDKALDDIILINYPTVKASAIASEVYQDIIDYGEDIIPVLDDNEKLIGALTAHDLVEVVDDELTEDYSKFASINGNVDLDSSVWTSIGKRSPWLFLLLFLGFLVSMLISSFGEVISSLTTMVFFQTVILGMAGNAGTQSLAVTIRILSEEEVDKKLIGRMFFKEIRVGFVNGLLLAIVAFISSFLYLWIFKMPITTGGEFSMGSTLIASSIIAIALLISMTVSSLIGCLIPIAFHALKVDPAVASGPLITTINDLSAVTIYYGLSMILLSSFL